MNDEEAEWSVEQALLGRGDTLRERIAALPRLLSNPTSTIPCRICATAATSFDVVDYHKVCGADPYRCRAGTPARRARTRADPCLRTRRGRGRRRNRGTRVRASGKLRPARGSAT